MKYYILVKRTASDNYLWFGSIVVAVTATIKVILCPEEWRAKAQLARYASGLETRSSIVFDSLEAAIAEDTRIGGQW